MARYPLGAVRCVLLLPCRASVHHERPSHVLRWSVVGPCRSLCLVATQLGVGEKIPCSYEPVVIKSLSGIGIRSVVTSAESTLGYAVSATGGVYSWGGGGAGALGIDFDFPGPAHIPTKGNTWFTKPVRVDQSEYVGPR